MFQVKSNAEIGDYLDRLVTNSAYGSMRQFGRACLKLMNPNPEYEPGVEELKNRSTKMWEIKTGRKGITMDDLPIFTHLLGVTCEELLSAGEYIVPSADHMTLRQFAASREKSVWDTFVKREDKVLLNCDEFGKTVVEYALESKNYELLKYLMEQGIIWFVGPDSKEYVTTFYGGACIGQSDPTRNSLTYEMRDPLPEKNSDRLRRQMIRLAIEHKDLKMLEELKAREIPTMYLLTTPGVIVPRRDQFQDDEMIRLIADSDDSIINYFSEEFAVQQRYPSPRMNTYMFPYIGRVAELMIQQEHPLAGTVVERCAEHNRKFLQQIKDTINKDITNNAAWYQDVYKKGRRLCNQELYQRGVEEMKFMAKEEFFNFWNVNLKEGGVTNLVSINCKSEDLRISSQIFLINDAYDEIMSFDK